MPEIGLLQKKMPGQEDLHKKVFVTMAYVLGFLLSLLFSPYGSGIEEILVLLEKVENLYLEFCWSITTDTNGL